MERWIEGWFETLIDSWSTATSTDYTTLATAIVVAGWLIARFFSR